MSWQQHRFAPQPGTALCSLEAVPDGGCKELRFGSGDAAFSLLLHRRGTEVRGYVNACPHFGLPLNAHPDEFLLLPEERVMCAWHCAVFRLEDGHCLDGPAVGMELEAVPLRLEGGQLFVAPGRQRHVP